MTLSAGVSPLGCYKISLKFDLITYMQKTSRARCSIKKDGVLHHSMQPQNCNFNSKIKHFFIANCSCCTIKLININMNDNFTYMYDYAVSKCRYRVKKEEISPLLDNKALTHNNCLVCVLRPVKMTSLILNQVNL